MSDNKHQFIFHPGISSMQASIVMSYIAHFHGNTRPKSTFKVGSDAEFLRKYFSEWRGTPFARDYIPQRVINWMENGEWEEVNTWTSSPRAVYMDYMDIDMLLDYLQLVQSEFGFLPSRPLHAAGWLGSGLYDGTEKIKAPVDRNNIKTANTKNIPFHMLSASTVLSSLFAAVLNGVDLETTYRVSLAHLADGSAKTKIHPAHRAANISFSYGSEWHLFFMAATATPVNLSALNTALATAGLRGTHRWELPNYREQLSTIRNEALGLDND